MDSASGNIIASGNSRSRSKKLIFPATLAVLMVIVAVVSFTMLNDNQSNAPTVGNGNNSGNSSSSNPAPSYVEKPSVDESKLTALDQNSSDGIMTAREAAYDFYKQVTDKLNNDPDYSYEDAYKDYSAQVQRLSDTSKLYFTFRYADFLYLNGDNFNEALKVSTECEPLVKSDEARLDYLINLLNLYHRAGKTAEAQVYQREIDKMASPDEEGRG